MPDRNDEYLEQLNIIKDNKRADRENSPEFILMNQRLSALNAAMNEMSAEGHLISPADVSSLRSLYAEAGAALEAYIKHLPTWVPERWRSAEGLARQRGVERLREFMQQDMASLDSYNTQTPVRLMDLLRDARNYVVNAPDRMAKIGAALSTREIIEQNGQKGVFTENAPVTPDDHIFIDVVDRRSARYGQADPEKPMMDALQRLNLQHETLWKLVKNQPADILSDLGKKFKEHNFSNLDGSILSKLNRLKLKMQRENYPYKILTTSQEVNQASAADIKFNTMIGEMLEEAAKLKASSNNLAGMNVETGRSIGDRNTAMSIVGDLIYCPDILARSTDMKLRLRNGREIQGTYMEWTKGNDIMELSKCAPMNERADFAIDFDSPKIIKDTGDLLALDYICGNTDRHMGNFHVAFRKDPDGVYRYKGLQGIDNDESFPVYGPKEMEEDKYGILNSHAHLPEDIAAMKETTARSILKLTKEKLTFALRHKLTQKEINAAWERTKHLQDHIRKGMAYNWMSDDEILPGQIHVIPDNSKAWDGMNLSAVAHATPRSSFYQTMDREFTYEAKKDIANARKQAVTERETPALSRRLTELIAQGNQAVINDPTWVDTQLDSKVKDNQRQVKRAEADRKRLAPDGSLKPILNQTQINLDYCDREQRDLLYQNALDMYDVYHSRRNLNAPLARNAANVLRKIEKDQMSHLFAPGYENHSAVKAAKMSNHCGRYFIDGEPAEKYAKRKYWSQTVAAEFAALPDRESKKTYMDNFVSAHVLAAMTGGRHHVDVAVLAQSEQGLLQVRLFEAKMNLGRADWNGRQDRIDSTTSKLKDRKTRQEAIRTEVKRVLQEEFDRGHLNAYRDTIRQLKREAAERIYRPGVQVNGNPHRQDAQPNGNPHRQERIGLENLAEPRRRANSFDLAPHPVQNVPAANQARSTLHR